MEKGIKDVVWGIQEFGVKTLSSCEGHLPGNVAYITIENPQGDNTLWVLLKVLRLGLLQANLEDIRISVLPVKQPEDSPYPSRLVVYFENYAKLLPRDKVRLGKHLRAILNRESLPRY